MRVNPRWREWRRSFIISPDGSGDASRLPYDIRKKAATAPAVSLIPGGEEPLPGGAMCRSRGGKTGDISLYLYIYRSAIRAWGRACLFLRRNVGMQISRKSLSWWQTTASTLMLSGYNGIGGGDGCHSRLSASEWRMLKDENENSRRRFSDRCDLALATMAFRSRKQPIWHVQITEFPELSFSVAGSLLPASSETLRFLRRLAPCGKSSDCRRRAK